MALIRRTQAVQPVPAPVPAITHWSDCTVPPEIAERMSDSETPRQWQMILSVDGDIAVFVPIPLARSVLRPTGF